MTFASSTESQERSKTKLYMSLCDSAEAHPRNDYPEEISEDEEEEEEEDDDDEEEEDEEEKSKEASDESEDEETSERHVRSVLGDDEFDGYGENVNGYRESDDEEFEYTKWSYR